MESKPNLNQMHHVMLNYRGGFRGKVPLGADHSASLGRFVPHHAICRGLPSGCGSNQNIRLRRFTQKDQKGTQKDPKGTQKYPKGNYNDFITIL